MSQIVTRKGPKGEDKEKRQTDSPVKEMKKKIAANAEKEKQAAEKNAEKPVQSDKKAEKSTEKVAEKPAEKEKKEKPDKSLDKSIDKKEKAEKSVEKNESTSDKKDKDNTTDKATDKKEKQPEKKDAPVEKASDNKEKNGKMDLSEDKAKKPETKVKENGAATNGEQNGDTVSSEDELQESDVERDEMFPELAYEDSDGETFEPPTPEGPSRAHTRRSQVKATRTPETPRPASGKHGDRDYVPDDSKLLKLKEDALSTDRKLRSADSPKPQDKKIEKVQEGKKSESPKKDPLKAVQEEPSKQDEKDKNESEIEIEVAVEVENEDERRVKADTNYSKSRVKVSPYRRSSRLADQTDLSLLANYTGNNTTMEMDITESSLDAPESPYLSGLRSIRARRSYRVLHDAALRAGPRATRPDLAGSAGAEAPQRPTGTVVGRKRRPEAEASPARDKRPRLLERLARPFRPAPPPARRAAEIVGINTDLPLSAPVASADTFDPEAIKPPAAPATLPTPLPSPGGDRDGKRCVVM